MYEGTHGRYTDDEPRATKHEEETWMKKHVRRNTGQET